ncbi:MAG: response regulator transcription factor [Chloroflexota bacterium]|jgi:two-component system, NarL family, nitrate/nitrite response regulator NarL
MDEPIRIIVLSDDSLARAGLAAFLATLPGHVVIEQGSIDFLTDSTSMLQTSGGDVIVWDLGWEAIDFELEETLNTNVPIIALVQDEHQASIADLTEVRGVLYRELDIEVLSAAIKAVLAGLTVIAPGLTLSPFRHPMTEIDEEAIELTLREHEVLALLAEGLTNKAIGQRLSISEHTVKFHVNAIMGKLNAQSRTDAVVRATRLGLISL